MLKAQPIAPLDGTAVSHLADIVAIPTERRRSFEMSVKVLFHGACQQHAWDITSSGRRPTVERQLSEIQEAVATLMERLAGSDKDTKDTLGIYKLHRDNFASPLTDQERRRHIADMVEGGQVPQGRREIDALFQLLQAWHDAAGTREWPKLSSGGAPSKSLSIPGNPAVTAFDLFSPFLSKIVHDHGGRLTLDKTLGTGTAIDFLHLAKPYLPESFIPQGILGAKTGGVLSGLSRLQKMIARGRRSVSATGQKPQPK